MCSISIQLKAIMSLIHSLKLVSLLGFFRCHFSKMVEFLNLIFGLSLHLNF